MNHKFLDWGLATAIIGIVITGFAQTWTSINQGTEYIACSADGRVLMTIGSIVRPVISTNSGVTWYTNASSPFGFESAVISADGTRLVLPSANPLGIYLSTNAGNTWQQTSAPQYFWLSLACTPDASKLFAGVANSGGVWFSTNSGSTWQPTSLPNANWSSLAISADGRKVAASGNNQVFVSTDAGNSWQSATVNGSSVAASADGGVLVVTGAGSTYMSTNFGGTWWTNAINGIIGNSYAGNSVAISADGKYLALADWNDKIYTSTNSGATWLTNNVPSQWAGISSTADGHRLFAASRSGQGIWIGQYAPSPRLNLTSTGGGVGLSWTIPSTNFILQQNSDLVTTNWSAVTNAPVLNLTNLQNQVTLPMSASNAFFRLKTP